MIQEKILELLGYGFTIEKITEYCLPLYNSNPYSINNFKVKDYEDFKKFVCDTIVLHGVFFRLIVLMHLLPFWA